MPDRMQPDSSRADRTRHLMRRRSSRRASEPYVRFRGRMTAFLLTVLALPATAQDTSVLAPVDSIEDRLGSAPFEIFDERGSRFEGDRTSRVALQFDDGGMMVAKWAPAPRGGETFNNAPRYEVAAYEIQKLFLDEPDYVVPPTVLRAFPLAWYRQFQGDASPTLRDTDAILVTLQYWLYNVVPDDFWDEDRFEADPVYARHFGNFNILTYLIRHNDANVGNFLISKDPDQPRVFSVDNGLSFGSRTSDRGARWRDLRVDRLPATTVERLRAITRDELTRRLETVAQFRIADDGQLVAMEPTENLNRGRGIRSSGGIVQFGLTSSEITSVWRRLERLLQDVDRGRIQVF